MAAPRGIQAGQSGQQKETYEGRAEGDNAASIKSKKILPN